MAALVVLVAVACADCGASGSSTSYGYEQKIMKSPGTDARRSDPPRAAPVVVDPQIAARLKAGESVEVLVTVTGDGDLPPAHSAATTGLLPGPYLAVKEAVLRTSEPNVGLVHDYDHLPTILVNVGDMAALTRLSASSLVVSIQPNAQKTTS